MGGKGLKLESDSDTESKRRRESFIDKREHCHGHLNTFHPFRVDSEAFNLFFALSLNFLRFNSVLRLNGFVLWRSSFSKAIFGASCDLSNCRHARQRMFKARPCLLSAKKY